MTEESLPILPRVSRLSSEGQAEGTNSEAPSKAPQNNELDLNKTLVTAQRSRPLPVDLSFSAENHLDKESKQLPEPSSTVRCPEVVHQLESTEHARHDQLRRWKPPIRSGLRPSACSSPDKGTDSGFVPSFGFLPCQQSFSSPKGDGFHGKM